MRRVVTSKMLAVSGTVAEVAELCADIFVRTQSFPKFNFGTVDEVLGEKELTELTDTTELVKEPSWYGGKTITTEFDSYSYTTAIFDYYGGGCANVIQFENCTVSETTKDSITKQIEAVIIKTISGNESVSPDSILVAEFYGNIYSSKFLPFDKVEIGGCFHNFDGGDVFIKLHPTGKYNAYNVNKRKFVNVGKFVLGAKVC